MNGTYLKESLRHYTDNQKFVIKQLLVGVDSTLLYITVKFTSQNFLGEFALAIYLFTICKQLVLVLQVAVRQWTSH